MTKKLHYIFLLSLFGTSCMANAASNIGAEPLTQGIGRNEVLPKEQASFSKEEHYHPLTSLSQDIKNHPVLWVVLSFLSVVPSLQVSPFYLIGETSVLKYLNWSSIMGIDPLKTSVLFEINEENNVVSEFWSEFRGAFFNYLCADFLLYAIVSILLASWATLWGNKAKKGERTVRPSFKVRFLRSFLFIFSLEALRFLFVWIYGIRQYFGSFDEGSATTLDTVLFGFFPTIGAIIIYAGLRVYDYWSKKALHEKKGPALTQPFNGKSI